MRTPRVYWTIPLNVGSIVKLPKDSAHHIKNVLRRKKGDQIIIFNEQGDDFFGEIIHLDGKEVQILLQEQIKVNTESSLELNLGLCLIKPHKMDYAIQKAVELGVTSIAPILSKRSIIHLNQKRRENKLEHWQKIVINASEQSGRTVIPEVKTVTKLTKWVTQDEDKVQIYLHPKCEKSLKEIKPQQAKINILIGPEGGLEDQELDFLKKEGWLGVSIGKRILRSETAAIASLAILQSRFGDMSYG